MAGEAQRVINVIGQVVDRNTANGARIQYTPGVVHEGSGAYEASAYVWVDELLDSIEVEAGSYVAAGDYVVVGISGEGRAWVQRILPTSMFARMAADWNRGRIFLGDGDTEPLDPGEPGQALVSGGPSASAYWGTAVGGPGGSLSDHTHEATGSGADGGGDTLRPQVFQLPVDTGDPTVEGEMVWDDGADYIKIGDGSGHREFGPLSDSAATTAAFGDAASAGTSISASRRNHVHGMPANPVTAHEAAGDPHPGYVTHAEGDADYADIAHTHTPDWGESGDIAQIDYADTAAAGSTGEFADAGHQHPVNAKFQEASMVFEFGPSAGVNDFHQFTIPWNCTIIEWTILGDVSGTCTIDIWVDTYANHPPTNADSITASATPAVSGPAIKNQSSTLTGWTTTLTKGDVIRVQIEAIATMSQPTLILRVEKT